ncbi:hypothetical protein SCUP234_07004 [Seiridium cupressi]
MKFSVATLFLSTIGSTSAAALKPRQESMSDYESTTVSLRQQGLCRTYEGIEPSYSKLEDYCGPLCDEANSVIDKSKGATSMTCLAAAGVAGIEYQTDPKGKQYAVGECLCNLPVVNWAADSFAAALPAVGQVTCSVWKLASVQAAKMLASTPFTPASTSMVLWKVAKLVKASSGNADKWEEYIKEHLAKGDSCDLNFSSFFEAATGVSDEDLQAIGVTS